MKTRSIALFCVLVLVASACGSRLSDDELSTGGGTGSGGAETSGDATEGPGISKGDGEGTDAGPKVGSLPVPCGKAEGGGEAEAPAGEVPGVTADTLKIAVISDRAGQVKVPTISIEESMEAFVGFCNSFGGINGRQLELTTIDSKLFNHLEATKEACNAGLLFATAAKAAGPDLTRDSVLAELKKIKKWDGGGLHLETNPGDNAVSTCFMYDVVKEGKFERLQPKKATEFDCDEDYAYELEKAYGPGAKKAG